MKKICLLSTFLFLFASFALFSSTTELKASDILEKTEENTGIKKKEETSTELVSTSIEETDEMVEVKVETTEIPKSEGNVEEAVDAPVEEVSEEGKEEKEKEEKEKEEKTSEEEERLSEEKDVSEEEESSKDKKSDAKKKKKSSGKAKKEKKLKSNKDEKAPVIKFTEEEFKMLACVVYLESGNQPFKGKVAVANAVINRVRRKDFPNTIKEVIHHKLYTRSGRALYQFTLAKPGGKLEQAMKIYGKRTVWWQKKYEKESIKAAKAALYGETAIPDNLCFWIMKNSAGWVLKNKPGGVFIKDHYFYKW